MPRLGERHAYWIWLKRGGRLSEVASPPTSTNSFRVQVPVCGNIASLVYLVVVYIRQSASIAPGQRAAACEVWVVGIQALVDPLLRLDGLKGEDGTPGSRTGCPGSRCW